MVAGIPVKSLSLRAWNFAIVAPSRAAWEFGAQCLVTSASIAMNAGFAQSHNILDPGFAWAQAIGFEWTYLRGLASAGKTRSRWVDAMNVIAFASVILYGLMFCLVRYKVIPDRPDAALSFFLAIVHVVPIGLTGLCAAMIHRAVKHEQRAIEDEERQQANDRQQRIQAEHDALELDRLRKEQELALWEQAQLVKQRLRATPRRPTTDRPPCPGCGGQLDGSDYALLKSAEARSARFGGCKACRGKA